MRAETGESRIIDVTPEHADEEPVRDEPARQGSTAGKVLLGLAIVLLAGVAGALYYAYDYWQDARKELEGVNETLATARAAQETLLGRIAETRRVMEQQKKTLVAQDRILQQQNAAIVANRNDLESQQQRAERERRELQEAREGLEDQLAEATRRLEGSPERWLVAEAEALLRTAENRLALGRDRDTALDALQRADALLLQAGPDWEPARNLLAGEIAGVEAYRPADTRALADELLGVRRQVRDLPLRAAVIPEATTPASGPPAAAAGATPASGWQRATDAGLRALRDLVTVHRTEPGSLPVLTAPYEAYLRQHLRLELDTARIGALGRDTTLFRTSIAAARDLLAEYFAPGPARDATIDALDRLAAAPLNPDPPPIGRTLSAIEAAKRQATLP